MPEANFGSGTPDLTMPELTTLVGFERTGQESFVCHDEQSSHGLDLTIKGLDQ